MNNRDNENGRADAAPVAIADEPVDAPAEPTGEGGSLLELLLAEHGASPAPPARIDGVVVGALIAIEASGAPRVAFPGAPEGGVVARGAAALTPGDVGRDVALLFEGGDPSRPIVMGKMHEPSGAAPASPRVVAQDGGERIELSAEKEIVLSCGKASITLTRAGKILISGEYVLSRSSGVHRIQGGSVQIN